MNSEEEKNYIINYHFLKIFKMYHVFYPMDKPGLKIGKYNINYHTFYPFFVLLELNVMAGCLIGFYYVINDLYAFVQLVLSLFTSFITVCKAIRFAQKYDEFWKLFDVMKVNFLSYSYYRKDILRNYRKKCVVVANIYAFIWITSCIFWIANPFIIKEYPVKNREGNIAVYRNNPLNIFLAYVSYEHYQDFYWIIYIIETIIVVQVIVDVILHDSIVILLCWMLSAQLETIAAKYETFGHKKINKEEDEEIFSVENLELIIADHIKVISKVKELYELIKPLTIIQLGIMSIIFNALTYMCVLMFFSENMFISVISLKLFLTAIGVMMNLFISGYFYGYLETQKDAMIFAMYSCNWTVKDIKFKKMLLHAIKMNNGNNLSMKVTPTKLVNIEMFSRVMNTSYSIISLLIKMKLQEQSN
ncbi:uncharacterized protein LOC126902365 isoform X2 [Daktulosphaira vitifoliae]|uniref:uncharacterized protein LOC126902365 isoform X2 n=1 Tax=Daktulosphaira vitifoliae TaxID=58002 RepID=UPI0021A9CC2F|nr:uncharacterized protein LOC126902365 isoform X2 [Daktulosphaira vitifoliae]